jgi:hypothetical protein
MSDGAQIQEFNGFLAAVQETYRKFGHQPWWRGQAVEEWGLVPGVFRIDRGPRYESNIAQKFAQRAPTRYDNCPAAGELAPWLFLMQHYRLRTRLLDWSESPLVALHFAVASDDHPTSTGALWALDPYRMNESQIREPGILQPGQPAAAELIRHAFGDSAPSSDRILALVAAEVDPRMMVQSAAMTIHSSGAPLETRPSADSFVIKFPIAPHAKAILRTWLERLGVRERALFPDLEHLAADLNRDDYR